MKTTLAVLATAMAIFTSAPAYADPGDQSSAETAVRSAYIDFQTRCTPDDPADFRSIKWENFTPAKEGAGQVIDANPALGGAFRLTWNTFNYAPRWDVKFEFC
ncbi:hypothetical protein A5740_16255 [Mycobacterium sp. GA-1841]|uniref:hypothetical protein n=1 Tax=Mycobacterium sp. GA-1841 TaxID=1834154 RepID=UPI00096D6BFD|nr:hypothetical protein [Mycobacterium sp. GA-1841]OMC30613.1 hypothetical protein A5740_16255 [Mycobacterium sp. GA-1841]